MPVFFRRLSLGLLLIAATSAVLLLSDLGSRREAAARTRAEAGRQVSIALLQHASQNILDDGREGMVKGLAEMGWEQGRNARIRFFNAEGDANVSQSIARQMAAGGHDLLLTITTVSLQAVANANRASKTPHVFGLVSDPYAAGVGISRENHLDHPPYLTGFATMQPVDASIRTARELNPGLRRLGTLFNPAETNSLAQMKVARATCAALGITLEEGNAENASSAPEAAAAVIARGVDALWLPGDVVVFVALDGIVAAARKARIPVFTVNPPSVRKGTLFDLGADYFEIGRQTGRLAGEVLNGRSPATIPVGPLMAENLCLNRQALAGLRGDWSFPPALVARAQLVLDEEGRETARAAQPAQGPPPPPRPGRTYTLGFAAFAPDPQLDLCQQGLLDGLRDLGFAEGKNLRVERQHAQGEVVNILPMIRNFDSSEVDVIVPFSTPVLQGSFQVRAKPVVFTYVTDPIGAGAGRSFTDHLPHVTGVGSLTPVEDIVAALLRLLPSTRRIGTVYNSGEANSVKIIGLLRESTRRRGIELVELTAGNTNEVLQAAQGIVSRQVDVFYLTSDNTAFLAYDGIRKVCQDARLPLVAEDPDAAARGALMGAGPGFYHSGKAAAPLLARVLGGESPAGIPMTNVAVNEIRIGREAITRLGLRIDPALIAELEGKR
ncbi:MAG: ABC transporter substrate-binding protein [Opitutaceae bacterium]